MRTVLYAIFFVLILLFSISLVVFFREPVEQKMIIPLMQAVSGRGKGSPSVNAPQESLIRSLEELKKENEVLRKQLGSLPEKADLALARVVWDSGNTITITAPRTVVQRPIESSIPVIVGDIFVGVVVRRGTTIALVRRPFDSQFLHEARTSRGVQGTVRGTYDQQVFFSFPVGKEVGVGDTVYVVEKNSGWKFVLGTVERLNEDKSKPEQTAWVRLAVGQQVPDTVFLVL